MFGVRINQTKWSGQARIMAHKSRLTWTASARQPSTGQHPEYSSLMDDVKSTKITIMVIAGWSRAGVYVTRAHRETLASPRRSGLWNLWGGRLWTEVRELFSKPSCCIIAQFGRSIFTTDLGETAPRLRGNRDVRHARRTVIKAAIWAKARFHGAKLMLRRPSPLRKETRT